MNIEYITLGYNFGKQVINKLKYVKSLRLALSVNNVYTITGYSGMTPLINSSNLDGTLGIDARNIYPLTRTFSLKLTAKFN